MEVTLERSRRHFCDKSNEEFPREKLLAISLVDDSYFSTSSLPYSSMNSLVSPVFIPPSSWDLEHHCFDKSQLSQLLSSSSPPNLQEVRTSHGPVAFHLVQLTIEGYLLYLVPPLRVTLAVPIALLGNDHRFSFSS